MRNRFFVPSFLFDFYSVRGSTATPSASSNVRQYGVRQRRTLVKGPWKGRRSGKTCVIEFHEVSKVIDDC